VERPERWRQWLGGSGWHVRSGNDGGGCIERGAVVVAAGVSSVEHLSLCVKETVGADACGDKV
jgi:hypothetical protein